MNIRTAVHKILLSIALGALWTAAQAATYTYRIPVPSLEVSPPASPAAKQYALAFYGAPTDAVALGTLPNVSFSAGFSLTTDFYVTGMNSSSYGDMLFNKENMFELNISPQYELEYAINCASTANWAWVLTGITVSPNQWHSVAMTYASTTGAVSLSMDGSMVYQGTDCSGMYPQNTSATLGNRTQYWSQPFEGKIKRFALWNGPISDSALTNLTAGTPVTNYTSGLEVYYPFTEGTGTVLNDQSGNGNNGALQGSVTWTTP